MRFSARERTGLIINMTLAETFLLVLFVIWYGHTAILRQDPLAPIMERLARLEKENERLTKELKQANDQVADLKRRLELWHRLTGFENPPTPEEFIEWRKEACRSHPKCEQNNVLVHASVVQGQASMVLLTESPRLSKWLRDSGRPRPPTGVRITDMRTIQAFLDAVRDYYANERAHGAECRFDYRLTYGSKEDYYDGRELFERYFYPAGLSRTGTGAR
ncbi:MAG: hypothetical protein QXS96_05025 [Candidatus Caldarchaeum sp.]